jgi:hypothetical protein
MKKKECDCGDYTNNQNGICDTCQMMDEIMKQAPTDWEKEQETLESEKGIDEFMRKYKDDKIKCFVRVCKFNDKEECKKFKDKIEMMKMGCALTWFITGQLPADTKHLHEVND